MSQIALRNENEPKTLVGNVAIGRGENGTGLAPQNLGDIVRFAEVMARAGIAIPKHLRDNPGACLAVCMQAFNWEMDPFSVAQKSYDVGGRMAYEAQLIAAVINTRAGLARRPQIEFEGEGEDLKCQVTFEADDGSVHVYKSPRIDSITTKNSPLWKSDPEQQLGYYSIRAGARRHFPEVILGVYDRDEIASARDVTPTDRPSLSSRLRPAPDSATQAREGFDRGLPADERRASPDASSQDAVTDDGDRDRGDEQVLDTAAEGDDDPAKDRNVTTPDAMQGKGSNPAGGDDATTLPDADREKPAPLDPATSNLLAEAAEKFLDIAGNEQPAKDRQGLLANAAAVWKGEIKPEHHERLKRVVDRANAVIKGALTVAQAVEIIAAEIGVKAADIRVKGAM